jgi:thiol-disulfide isomerase/thioredoxin
MKTPVIVTSCAALIVGALLAANALSAADEKAAPVGKPLDIKFTAVDGRAVDLSEMKGKVVLVDFWATWCGPCVAEIPRVKEAYTKLHSKGFEIVGISFDKDKAKLESFVKDKGMEWPQFFDGKAWQNEYGQKYGINAIPTMWLVDKKGNLREPNARGDLAAKVEKLLAE